MLSVASSDNFFLSLFTLLKLHHTDNISYCQPVYIPKKVGTEVPTAIFGYKA